MLGVIVKHFVGRKAGREYTLSLAKFITLWQVLLC